MKREKPFKYLFNVEYCGKRYSGWQIQPNGMTVQEILQDAFAIVGRQPSVIKAASRTDAGVHAKEQLVTVGFDAPFPSHPLKLLKGVNALTPKDIVVTDLVMVDPEFNLRKSIVSKTYRYNIHCGNFPPGLDKDYYWWMKRYPSPEKINRLIPLLIGTKDFHAFRAANCGSPNTVKTMRHITVVEETHRSAKRLHILINGSGFLKNMVRIIVGSLVDFSLGKLDIRNVEAALSETGKRALLGRTAPAEGLTLEQIHTQLPFHHYEKNNV